MNLSTLLAMSMETDFIRYDLRILCSASSLHRRRCRDKRRAESADSYRRIFSRPPQREKISMPIFSRRGKLKKERMELR